MAYRVPRYSVALVREGNVTLDDYPRFANSAQCWRYFRPIFQDFDREHFAVVTLDAKNRMIGFQVVSVGSLSDSIVIPRETMKAAILQSAAAVICLHNHPSGDSAPSREDRACTERLARAFGLVGIRLLDHIVIGLDDYFSFADAGIISQAPEQTPAPGRLDVVAEDTPAKRRPACWNCGQTDKLFRVTITSLETAELVDSEVYCDDCLEDAAVETRTGISLTIADRR
jgi:DNA repair protein RadC